MCTTECWNMQDTPLHTVYSSNRAATPPASFIGDMSHPHEGDGNTILAVHMSGPRCP